MESNHSNGPSRSRSSPNHRRPQRRSGLLMKHNNERSRMDNQHQHYNGSLPTGVHSLISTPLPQAAGVLPSLAATMTTTTTSSSTVWGSTADYSTTSTRVLAQVRPQSAIISTTTRSSSSSAATATATATATRQLLPPSRRVDAGDDSPNHSPAHRHPRSSNMINNKNNNSIDSTETETESSVMVSRLPSRRHLLTHSAGGGGTATDQSFTSHSTGQEFEFWATLREQQGGSSRTIASSASNTSSVPSAPHLLRLTTQSSARDMMVGGSSSSIGSSTSPHAARNGGRRRRRLGPSQGISSTSNNNNNNNLGAPRRGRRPVNPMAAMMLQEQVATMSLASGGSVGGDGGGRSVDGGRSTATTTTTTSSALPADCRGTVVHDSNDKDNANTPLVCEMPRLAQQKSGSSVSSLPSFNSGISICTPPAGNSNSYSNGGGSRGSSPVIWQGASHHYSAFHRRASM